MIEETHDEYGFKDRLLPCPFCGKNDDIPPVVQKKTKKYHDLHYSVYCSNCGAECNHYSATIDEAINVWNRRAKLDVDSSFLHGFNTAIDKMTKMLHILQSKHTKGEE